MLHDLMLLCVIINTVFCQITYDRFDKLFYFLQWIDLRYDFDGDKFEAGGVTAGDGKKIYFEEHIQQYEKFLQAYNNVPEGLEVYKNKVFITVPRRRFGAASTLNYVDIDPGTPYLKPYPNVKSVSGLVSVYRPRVDECDRLWVVDTGYLGVYGNRFQVKKPEVIIFDLKTDTEMSRYQLKPTDLINGNGSGLVSITVDVTASTCEDAYAYITDIDTGGLIVYSLKQSDSWRFDHPSLTYDDGAKGFSIGKYKLAWKGGVNSIALSDPDEDGIRTAYYHPLVATQEFSIRTDVLKNRTGNFDSFKVEGVRGAWSQSGAHAYHSDTRTLLFANLPNDGILCWNVDKPLTAKNTALVVKEQYWLKYVADLKVVGENVWLMVNQYPRYNQFNPKEANFIVYWAKISDLVKGTVCDIEQG